MEYEIVAYESQRIYGQFLATDKDVLEIFMQAYSGYMMPKCIEQIDIEFHRGKYHISYSDLSMSKEKIILLLVGPINEELVSSILKRVDALYDKN